LEPPSEGAGATHACNNLFKQGYKEGETDAGGVIDTDAPLHSVEGVAHVEHGPGEGREGRGGRGMYDLKITHGLLVDGTGAAPREGAVAIKDGVIVAVGECDGAARRTLDAEGGLVTPGFVDLHTHYDGQISWDAELAPSCYHGVTTAILGNCGVGFAPVRPGDRERLVALMQGVEDIPGTALSEGITWDWESFPQYMDALDRRPHTMDYALQVPHDALRVYVMGERGVATQAATDEDLAQMKALMREALDAGALGFSTGRTDNHRAVDGSPTPASEANVRELCAIASAFQGVSHGVLQAVSDFDMVEDLKRFDPEFDVLEQMAAASGGHPLSLSLLQRLRDTEQWKKILRRVEGRARPRRGDARPGRRARHRRPPGPGGHLPPLHGLPQLQEDRPPPARTSASAPCPTRPSRPSS
jgi:hypothetical protein